MTSRTPDFPNLSAAWAPTPEAAVARLRAEARAHAAREAAGSATDRTRARAAAAAYIRAAALIEELEALRPRDAGKNQQPRPAPRDN